MIRHLSEGRKIETVIEGLEGSVKGLQLLQTGCRCGCEIFNLAQEGKNGQTATLLQSIEHHAVKRERHMVGCLHHQSE